MELAVFTVLYALSAFVSGLDHFFLSGSILLITALGISWFYYQKYERLTSPLVVFSLSWIGGIGVSCFKLSFLQTKWEMISWICFYLAYIVFALAYKLCESKINVGNVTAEDGKCGFIADLLRWMKTSFMNSSYILAAMNAVAICSIICLMIEGKICGYIPIFLVDTPHAYSYFHVSGVHYFTISCVMLPALAVLYLDAVKKENANLSVFRILNASICASLGIVIPILLVSRYQMLFALMLAASTLAVLKGGRLRIHVSKRNIILSGLIFLSVLAMYVFITIQRDHSVAYLNGIFEIRYSSMPIFISQPYIYIANNFDNFNCLVKELPAHTYGLRMLFPVIALTGLKFIRPELAAFPIYVTKEELTTVTLIYDAYYDFGIIGVILFAAVLGIAAALLERYASKNSILTLLYAQFLIYLGLAFFTTWFSNPTTWFLFGLTVLIGISAYLVHFIKSVC